MEPAGDTLKKRHQDAEVSQYLRACGKTGHIFYTVDHPDLPKIVKNFLAHIRPMSVVGQQKIRIGGPGDGGYVMLDPGTGGTAYSFGVSTCSPWDLEMAQRDFRVHQYDGSIDREPDPHPNIFFNKYYIGKTCSENPPTTALPQIIRDNGHKNERDIILQIDIEGAEWEFFESISRGDMLRFKQIIVEFHHLVFSVDRLYILKKILETHTPVHIHNNNNSNPFLILPDNFLYNGAVFEVTYARTRDYEFQEDNGYYPTSLDTPNVAGIPDIPIGYFDVILGS